MGPDLMSMKSKASDESGSLSSGVDAAKDVIAAIKAGDAKALNLALQRHYECCSEPDADDAED